MDGHLGTTGSTRRTPTSDYRATPATTALWDSRLYNYENWEVQRYLLSNLSYALKEYGFDGFRFDGVTSMLYNRHPGCRWSSSATRRQYLGLDTWTIAAVNYLMMANDMLHERIPASTSIAEDVSGMPRSCRPVRGRRRLRRRLAMGHPRTIWVRLLKASREDTSDEDWSMHEIIAPLSAGKRKRIGLHLSRTTRALWATRPTRSG